ncbi:MAG: cytochrome C, partial [Nitrospirota bacterium]
PVCQDCHGSPHPAGIMAKFPKCGECHNIAHDLNNWSASPKPVTTKPAVKKKSKQEAPKRAPKEAM